MHSKKGYMQKNRKPCLQDFPIHSVQKKGVEPSRYCYHTDLNRARLPIPPLLREHICIIYQVFRFVKKFSINSNFLNYFENSFFLRMLCPVWYHRWWPISFSKKESHTAFLWPMQKKGVEPSRYCYHTDLNRARLPIPPLLHEHKYYTIVLVVVNWILKIHAGDGTWTHTSIHPQDP